MEYNTLLDGLLKQLKNYSTVHRKSIQPFTKGKISQRFPEYDPQYDDEVIRESLMEHVGCLPIIATYLHPYMDREVNLGRALIMIAIHDIGELVVGDELTFTKSEEQSTEEHDAAMDLLHADHKALYWEMDELRTNDALFVKSVDKMAPDIYDYICGEQYSIGRMVIQTGWTHENAIDNVRERKRPYMEWSSFLTGFHDELFNRFETCIRQV